VPGAGLEPARGKAPRDFKSLASTSSAIQASFNYTVFFTVCQSDLNLPVSAGSLNNRGG
jgi:hypothetical protein